MYPESNNIIYIREKYRKLRYLTIVSFLAGSIIIAGILLWKAQGSSQEDRGPLLMAAGIILAMLPVDLAFIWYITELGANRAVRLATCLEKKFGTIIMGLKFGMLSYRWDNNTVTVVTGRPSNGLYVARVEIHGLIVGSKEPRLMWDLFRVPLSVVARKVVSSKKCTIYSWEKEGVFTVPIPHGQWARIKGKARVAAVECMPGGRDVCGVLDDLLELVNSDLQKL